MPDKSIRQTSRFCAWLCISLILNGYASGVPGVSLGSACFIFFVFSAIRSNKWRFDKTSEIATIAILAFAIISLLDIAFGQYEFNPLSFFLSYSKVLIWWAFICFVSQTYYNLTLLTKWLVRIGIILNIYLIIQNVAFYGMGIYLPNIFSFGPLVPYDEGYANYAVLGASKIIRPASLLSESSFLGNYLMLTLTLVLKRFSSIQRSKNDAKLCLFFTLGIFLTSSTSAILLTVVIWFFLGYNLIRRYKLITCLLSISILFYIFTNNVSLDSFNNSSATSQAIFRTFDKLNYMDSNVRFGASYRMLDYLSPIQQAFGVGFGNEQAFIQPYIYNGKDYMYLNSITQFIINVGYIGAIFLFLFFGHLTIMAVKYRDKVAMALICIYIIKVFGSGFLFSTYGTLYIFVIVGSLYSHKNSKQIYAKLSPINTNTDKK